MSKVIELEDSEDEHSTNISPSQDTEEAAASNSMDDESSNSELETNQGRALMESLSIAENNEDDSNSTSTQQTSTNEQPRARHHRRKSSHHAVRSTSDMEFAMMPVESEIDANNTSEDLVENHSPEKVQNGAHKSSSITPNILQSKQPTLRETVDAEFDDFMDCDETRSVIRDIAIERLRINTMLTLNGMPEIDFSLYTQPETLRFQLENRFKQRKLQQQSETNNPN